MPLHSIYALCEPDGQTPRYVGKTSMVLKYRLSSHVSSARKNDGQPALLQWINGLLGNGQKPQIVLLEECTPNDIDGAEVAWIAECTRNGYPLLNRVLLPKVPKQPKVRIVKPRTKAPDKLDWTVRKNITLPEDMHAEIKLLSQRDGVPVYAVIVEAIRLYKALHQNGNDHDN